MTTFRLILGSLGGLALMLLGLILEGGHLSSVIQLTAFVIVAGGTAGYLVASFPLRTHRRSLALAVGKNPGETGELRVARQYFVAAADGCRLFGVVGAVFGLIHVMENLDKPEMLGPGIAVAFVALLYGFLLPTFFIAPLAELIGEKLIDSSLQQSTLPSPGANDTSAVSPDDAKSLHAKIGELVMQLQDKNNRTG